MLTETADLHVSFAPASSFSADAHHAVRVSRPAPPLPLIPTSPNQLRALQGSGPQFNTSRRHSNSAGMIQPLQLHINTTSQKGYRSQQDASMPEAKKVVAQLEALASKHELTVVRLSEPITSAVEQTEATTRTSDISTASLDAPTPASLEADLEHYKELFAKLRFSYVEQVTKEKFIRAIVGDPPLIVDPAENAELEARNGQAKAELKTLKREVAELVAELERQGAELARRHMRIGLE
ncbi:hypothetical protein MAPG_10728, partial [Magnaporthiopsis poae ATCC 64411]